VTLIAEHLKVTYGGVTAVNDLSIEVPVGQVTGLIGPNGAGKTTTFNACSGLLRPRAGRVALFGEDISRLGPPARARRGLGRSFQRMTLCDSLSVRENVALGREAAMAGGNIVRQLYCSPGERRAIRDATDAAIARCGLDGQIDRRAGELSTGERRLVELARVIAGGFRILLLDEPSSGLDSRETEAFGRVLRSLVDASGVGILLVEHDISLVCATCERTYVLDFGELLCVGATEDVMASDAVRAAYLGAIG
jgi:ABC-type branched-subunit amino acid transport system ATPase component